MNSSDGARSVCRSPAARGPRRNPPTIWRALLFGFAPIVLAWAICLYLALAQRQAVSAAGGGRGLVVLCGLGFLLTVSIAGAVLRRTVRLERGIRDQQVKDGQNASDLQRLSGRLVDVLEQERRHVARELHDEIGQALTAIKMELSRAERSQTAEATGGPLESARAATDSALHTVRDLTRMRGQVVTIAVVVSCGIAILIAAVATYQSLLATQADYYRQGRFADVFASAKRAPEALAARLAEIPGIGVLETRVAEDVTIRLADSGEPLTAHVVSVPDAGPPQLNRLYLRHGRTIEPGADDEVLMGEAFATANHLRPGDALTAILNGRLKRLRVVGIVLSPEYVFATRPGDPIPDDSRYGVMWMGRKALASAFDMEGAFNDIVALLAPGADDPRCWTRSTADWNRMAG